MSARIPLAVPDVGESEEQAVAQAMRSGWVAPAGPDLAAFEDALADRTGRRHAVAVSSGTAALHLSLLAAGVRAGDVVVCATLTFIATANAIRYIGAVPVFVDSDDSGTMDPALLEEALRHTRDDDRRIGAIVPVDIFGKSADYAAIEEIASTYGVPVVSDAAESLGSTRQGEPAGSFGMVAALSFNGNKIITTSSGGAVVTNDKHIAERVRHLATQARQPVAHYEHEEVGYNYRLSNILAALGRAQLSRLDEILEVKRAHRDAYRSLCDSTPGLSILGGDDSGDNCWLTPIIVDPQTSHADAQGIVEALEADDIESRPVFKPLHMQPVFADCIAFPRYMRGRSEAIYAQGIVVPSGASLTSRDRQHVINAISSAVVNREASGANT